MRFAILAVALTMTSAGFPETEKDALKLFEKGRKECFEQKWKKAHKRFDEFRRKYSGSQYSDDVCFLAGNALEHIPGREKEAFETYTALLNDYPDSPWIDNAIIHQIRRAGSPFVCQPSSASTKNTGTILIGK